MPLAVGGTVTVTRQSRLQSRDGESTLLLLVGHLCATEFSPDGIKHDFSPRYPGVHSFRGDRRPRGVQ